LRELTWAADGRERAEWCRGGPLIAALAGVPLRQVVPERYWPQERESPPTADDTRRGLRVWAAAWLGAPPAE
jgi:hypothetical protein